MIKKLILLGCIILAESTTLLAQIVKVHTIGDSTMAGYMEKDRQREQQKRKERIT